MDLKVLTASAAAALSAFALSAHAQQTGSQHSQQHAHQHAQGQAHGQHQGAHHHMPGQAQHTHGHMSYAEFKNREIKALSPEQIEGLRAGRGMSLALAAELNGFPGPMHALELASELKLTDEQRTKVQALFSTMQSQAKKLGEELIAAERELDTLFKSKQINAALLTSQTQKIAQVQGRLRAVHLGTHLDMVQILTPEQVSAYNRLRGY